MGPDGAHRGTEVVRASCVRVLSSVFHNYICNSSVNLLFTVTRARERLISCRAKCRSFRHTARCASRARTVVAHGAGIFGHGADVSDVRRSRLPLSNRSRALVAFQTDNCRDCLLMESEWEEMGEEHEESTSLLVGKVNCEAKEGSWAKLLCDRYKVGIEFTLLLGQTSASSSRCSGTASTCTRTPSCSWLRSGLPRFAHSSPHTLPLPSSPE